MHVGLEVVVLVAGHVAGGARCLHLAVDGAGHGVALVADHADGVGARERVPNARPAPAFVVGPLHLGAKAQRKEKPQNGARPTREQRMK